MDCVHRANQSPPFAAWYSNPAPGSRPGGAVLGGTGPGVGGSAHCALLPTLAIRRAELLLCALAALCTDCSLCGFLSFMVMNALPGEPPPHRALSLPPSEAQCTSDRRPYGCELCEGSAVDADGGICSDKGGRRAPCPSKTTRGRTEHLGEGSDRGGVPQFHLQSDECPNHSLCGAHRLRVSPTCCRCRRPEPQRGCGGAAEGRCECPHGDNTRRDPLNAL